MSTGGWNPSEELGDDEPILSRRPLRDDSEMDITPMIDITFLLLIFFLVASIPDSQTAVVLPPAQYGSGVDPRGSVIVTIAETGVPGQAEVYLADGKQGEPLAGIPEDQERQVVTYLESGQAEGRSHVIVKAERGVSYNEVDRIAGFVGLVSGMQLHVAVFESE